MLIDLLAVGMLGTVSAASVSATELVSINRSGTNSGAGSDTIYPIYPNISADGRFVVFSSKAYDLVAKDTNGTQDVFVRDIQHGTTTLVSINKDSTGSASGSSSGPNISADGRFVVFTSAADDLVDTDTNGRQDVFVRDLQNGTTTLVSVNKEGTDSGNGSSRSPSISADGRFVAFISAADNLVAEDNQAILDVFVRDLQNGTTTLVSVNKEGTDSGTGDSTYANISADGRFVVFQSYASDLVTTDTNGTWDVFVRDLQSGTTTLVSINKGGTDSGARESYGIEVSADGRFVAFMSDADDLVASDTNGSKDVFVRDLLRRTTALVSVNINGTDSGTGLSWLFKMSADGRFVGFSSKAHDLVATDTNGTWDAFVRDRKSGTTTLVSVNKEGTDSGAGVSTNPVISADGRFVAFESGAENLVATDTNGTSDVFVRDLQNGTTALISSNKEGTDSGSGSSTYPIISTDGRFVAFTSKAYDLVASDTNGAWDVFGFETPKGLLKSLSFDALNLNAGDEVNGIVMLTGPAPLSGAVVSLSSSKPGVASVPDNLMIPPGSDSSPFVVSTSADACSTWVGISATGANATVANFLHIASAHSIPSKPTGFKKYVFKGRWLSLSWDSMPNVENFILDRKKANQNWVFVGKVAGGQTFFRPPPQIPCVRYNYRLRAVNHCGSSAAVTIGHLYDDGSCPF